MVSNTHRRCIGGRPELIDIKAGKRGRSVSRGRATKKSKPQPQSDQRQEGESRSSSGRPSSHDSTVANDTDTPTEIIDHRYLALRQAVVVLNDERQLLMDCEVATEAIHRQTVAIWAAIRSASESYERCFAFFEHTEALLVMRKQIYVVGTGTRRHHHELTRSAQMARIVANVLRTEIFEADLSSQLQQVSPLPTRLDLLHQGRELTFPDHHELQLTWSQSRRHSIAWWRSDMVDASVTSCTR